MQIGELRRDRQTGEPAGAPAIVKSDVRAADANVLVVGAGPYGLAAAAHLRSAGIESHVLGRPMEFWQCHMPRGMLLRSPWRACHIADPDGAFSLDAYARSFRVDRTLPVPLEDFCATASGFSSRWFRAWTSAAWRASLPAGTGLPPNSRTAPFCVPAASP